MNAYRVAGLILIGFSIGSAADGDLLTALVFLALAWLYFKFSRPDNH